MSETNGKAPEPQPQQMQMQVQLSPQGVVLTFPVSLMLDNDMMKQLIKTYLQNHPELVQEIAKEALAQKQQEWNILQMVKKSRNE